MTDRGRTAAAAVRTAIDGVEATLAQLIGARELHALRVGLAAYREIRDRSDA